jgi:hypothetical protein
MSNTEAFVGLKYEWNPVSENYSADMDLNLQRIGAMLNLVVQSKTLTVPPSSVANGQAWIVATGASGAWAGKDNNIAAFTNNAWLFIAPIVGLKCFNLADNTTQLWSGSPASWAQDASTAGGGGGGGGGGVSSIGGETGAITLGSGLEIAGTVLSATSGGGGGGGGSLTITDGSTVLNNVSEVLVKNLGLTSAGGPPAIVQYANFPNGGNVYLGQSVKVGNTLVICTIGQQPPSSLGGLDLAVQSGGSPDAIAFYAGTASSAFSPEVSINYPASIFEISGVISTVTSAVAVANSSSTYSIPFSDVNANSFVLVATNAVSYGNNNNGAGSTDFTPNETYKIQYSTVAGQSVGGLIFGVPDPVTVDSELTFNDPENSYTQAILLEFVGSSPNVPTITPTIPLTINGTTPATFTSLNVTTTGDSSSASVSGGVLTLGLPVSSGGGGGGGDTGTALTFSGTLTNFPGSGTASNTNAYKSDQSFTFAANQKISLKATISGKTSYTNIQGVYLSKDGINFYSLQYQTNGNVIAYYNSNRGNYFNVPLFQSKYELELLIYATASGGNNYVTGNFEGIGAFLNTGLVDNNLDMTNGAWYAYVSVDELSDLVSASLTIS